MSNVFMVQGVSGDVLDEETGPRDAGHQGENGEVVTGVHRA